MNKDDFCQSCGYQKLVLVTTVDGCTNTLPPGSSTYIPQDIVVRIECACSGCGLLYSMSSLMSVTEVYE